MSVSGFALAAALVVSAAPPIVVVTDLPAPARALVVARLRELGVAGDVDVRLLDSSSSLEASIASSPGPTLVVGPPLAAFAPLLDRFVRCADAPPEAGADLADSDRRVLPLWFDPVVVAARASGELTNGATSTDLPSSLAELTRGGFEGRVSMTEPAAWNSGGQVVATIAITAESVSAGDRSLTGLDANVGPRFQADDAVVLARLAAAPETAVALVTRSAWIAAERESNASGMFRTVRPRGGPVVVVRGAAAAHVDPPTAAVWMHAFDADLVRAVANAADIVPLAPPARADDDQDDDVAADRVLIEANAETVQRAQFDAAAPIARFKAELRGTLERRAERFSEWFDTLGITAIVAVVVALLWRRRGPSERPDAGSPAPE